ncbi:MAG: hypothetical protein IT258_15320 [Saprospiraceae bacterium]|nr:hypothetical protein [Saprospiraceae bacterium]
MTATEKKKSIPMQFSRKYRTALPTVAFIAVEALREKHPEWPLNKTLGEILSTTNPDMPPQFLLEFTQHIIQHWIALEAKQAEAIAA